MLFISANKYRQLGCASSVPSESSNVSEATTGDISGVSNEEPEATDTSDGASEYDTIAQAPIIIPRMYFILLVSSFAVLLSIACFCACDVFH